MGKSKSKRKPRKRAYAYKGWKCNSADGQFLARLFRKGELSPAAMPSLIKERYPQFQKYKTESFAAGLRRLKAKLGLNTRHAGGEDTGKSVFCCLLCLLVLFLSLGSL